MVTVPTERASSPIRDRTSANPSRLVDGVFGLLDPIPFGCFVAALIFDITYARTAVIIWDKGAAWLIVFGLLFAVVPRLIDLVRVWIRPLHRVTGAEKLDFWLHLLAIVAAIFNAFVHSRDAYATMPAGLWLSACTVLLMSVGQVVRATDRAARRGYVRE